MRITYKKARKAVAAAIAKVGVDHVYQVPESLGEAAYFDPATDEASCVVGHGLSGLGITASDVGMYNTGTSVTGLADAGVIDATPAALKFLDALQERQDTEAPWGVSFVDAIAMVEGVDLDADR